VEDAKSASKERVLTPARAEGLLIVAGVADQNFAKFGHPIAILP